MASGVSFDHLVSLPKGLLYLDTQYGQTDVGCRTCYYDPICSDASGTFRIVQWEGTIRSVTRKYQRVTEASVLNSSKSTFPSSFLKRHSPEKPDWMRESPLDSRAPSSHLRSGSFSFFQEFNWGQRSHSTLEWIGEGLDSTVITVSTSCIMGS